MIRRKGARGAQLSVDSTLILGDLTDVTQISRSGNTVTLHGREDPRTITLGNDQQAAAFWQALATEASHAVSEDRQFFCVSFGAIASELSGTVH